MLDRIEIEHASHGGAENGKLPVTYDDFHLYGMHRHAIAPAIRECVALGFLEVTDPGRGGNAEFRKPNLFRLTYLNTNTSPTNDWERINEDVAKAIAQKARSAVSRQKQKSSDGKRHLSVTETGIENQNPQ